jgi:xanthine dehydrogenase accessory factor
MENGDVTVLRTLRDWRKAGKRAVSSAPALVKHGVTADEAHRFGLPCGGTLELLLEYNPDAASLDELVQALASGRLMRRAVRLADGCVTLYEATVPEELGIASAVLVNTFGPEFRMLLIGAGQLTEYLACREECRHLAA